MKVIHVNAFFLKLSLFIFTIIACIQIGAGMFDWYYIFPQLDVPMHVLGGMLVGFATLAVLPESMQLFKKLLWVIIITMSIGVGVEVVEWLVDTLVRPIAYQALQQGSLDTYSDLLHDWLGGMLAFCFAYFTKKI